MVIWKKKMNSSKLHLCKPYLFSMAQHCNSQDLHGWLKISAYAQIAFLNGNWKMFKTSSEVLRDFLLITKCSAFGKLITAIHFISGTTTTITILRRIRSNWEINQAYVDFITNRESTHCIFIVSLYFCLVFQQSFSSISITCVTSLHLHEVYCMSITIKGKFSNCAICIHHYVVDSSRFRNQ